MLRTGRLYNLMVNKIEIGTKELTKELFTQTQFMTYKCQISIMYSDRDWIIISVSDVVKYHISPNIKTDNPNYYIIILQQVTQTKS